MAAFGDRAQSLVIGPDGAIAVPDGGGFGSLDLPFFQPQDLQSSSVIIVAVAERFGDFPGEIGPGAVGARARTCDNQEVCLSLPDVLVAARCSRR